MDEINENTVYLKTTKTARISVSGKITPETKTIWIVLHGYGELSPYFIRKFNPLKYPENVIIAPEALSRFYLNGFNGRVGATWMTKEERETDIKDYIEYLENVYSNFIEKELQINVIGFSQGAATASRWIGYTNNKIDNLILWCGVFPPDLPLITSQKYQKLKNILLVNGNNDEFITTQTISESINKIKSGELKIKEIIFDGGHEISPSTLIEVQQLLS